MKIFTCPRRFARTTRAAALVEFTLMFPLLFALGAGVTEFGFMLHQQQVLTKSVREAGRYATRVNFTFKSCPLNTQPEWTQLVTDTQNMAMRGSINPSAPLLLREFNNVSMVTIADTCVTAGTLLSPAGGGTNIPVITVTATVPFNGVGFLSALNFSSFNLRATHQQMWSGL